MMKTRLALLSLVFVLGAGPSAYADELVTYEGQIIKPDSNPLENASVDFRLKIFNQAKTCLLWQETQNLNMTGSEGNFKISIGAGTNTATPVTSFRAIFQNAGALTCNGGSTYSPPISEQRTLLIEFDDDADTNFVILDEIPVSFAPYAFHSTTVGGYTSSYLFRTDAPFASNFPIAGVTELFNFSSKANLAPGISGLGAPTAFGDQNNIPVVTVNEFGRVTNVSTVAVSLTASNIGAGSVTNAKLGTNAVTTDKIQDGTIVDADLSAAAAIVDTKLGTISSVGKVSNSATTATAANTNNAIVARDASGHVAVSRINSTEVRLDNGAGGLISIFSPMGSNTYSLNLPPSMGTTGQFLQTDGTNQANWVTLVGLPTCTSNQIAYFDGSIWICKTWSTANTASAIVARDGSGNSDFNQVNVTTGVQYAHGSGGTATVRGASTGSTYSMRLPGAGPTVPGDSLVHSTTPGQLAWSSAANQRLKVGGQLATTHYDFANAASVDFDSGNIQYSNSLTSCTNLLLNNMQDGTTYTVMLDNLPVTLTCTFAVGGVTNIIYSPSNRATVANSTSIYRLTKIGARVFVEWTTGIIE
jgi:hypothetical protein